MKEFSKYKITYSLILICIIIYIITTLLYGLEMNATEALSFMGFNPAYVQYTKSYYRIVTANFIHFGILHLAVNCISLYNVGTFMERTLSFKNYLFIIIVSMIATNGIPYILYLLINFNAYMVSGGISGVICGLIGSIIALAYLVKGSYVEVFRSILPSILLMLYMSIASSSISLSGHLSGMIGGFIATYIVVKFNRKTIIN